MLRTSGSMAKQHVRCWKVIGPKVDIAKSTRLTRTGHAGELRNTAGTVLHPCRALTSPTQNKLWAGPGPKGARLLQRWQYAEVRPIETALLRLEYDLNLAAPDGRLQGGVVALGLVGIGNCEFTHRGIEIVLHAEI